MEGERVVDLMVEVVVTRGPVAVAARDRRAQRGARAARAGAGRRRGGADGRRQKSEGQLNKIININEVK